MSLSLYSLSPICRRGCLHALPRTRYQAVRGAASASAVRSPPPQTAEKLSNTEKKRREREAEAEKKKQQVEAERRRSEIAARRESPFKDPMNTAIALPLMAVKPPVSWSSLKGFPIRARLRWLYDQFIDTSGNGVTLVAMARTQRMPLTDLSKQPKRFWERWLVPFFSGARSTRLEPLTKHALDMYIKTNEAVASGDHSLLRTLCQNEYLEEALRRHRTYGPNAVLEWKFHGEASPTRILSIREANMPTMDGKFVFLVHALVRFDTMQSLIVTRHAPRVKGARSVAPATTPVTQTPPKRVTEYVVLEGRSLGDLEQWKLRSQFYDDPAPYLKKPEAKDKKQ